MSKITRRKLLKFGSAILGGILLGIGANRLIEKKKWGRRQFTRSPQSSVPKVLENYPDSQKKEMAFSKEIYHWGSLDPMKVERGEGEIKFIEPLKGNVKSIVHTHLLKSNAIEQVLATNNPSLEDILYLVEHALLSFRKNPPKIPTLRVIHVAPMNANGEVMGYFSFRLGKKLFQNPENLTLCWAELNHMRSLERELPPMQSKMALLTRLEALKNLGLQFRISPRPGFEYKEFHFQKKIGK